MMSWCQRSAWELLRLRTLCMAGRACAADGASTSAVALWVSMRAPLWVVVRVCEMLQPRPY